MYKLHTKPTRVQVSGRRNVYSALLSRETRETRENVRNSFETSKRSVLSVFHDFCNRRRFLRGDFFFTIWIEYYEMSIISLLSAN